MRWYLINAARLVLDHLEQTSAAFYHIARLTGSLGFPDADGGWLLKTEHVGGEVIRRDPFRAHYEADGAHAALKGDTLSRSDH